MVTAYDFPSAIHVARAGIDIILVGDSVAMVELGHDTTQPVTMDQMIHHCSAVRRGVRFANVPAEPLLVGDMPFGSYEYEDTDRALHNAYRFMQEAGMDAVKVEVCCASGVVRAIYYKFACNYGVFNCAAWSFSPVPFLHFETPKNILKNNNTVLFDEWFDHGHLHANYYRTYPVKQIRVK